MSEEGIVGEAGRFTRAALIVNAGARHGQEEVAKACDLLKAAGVPLVATYALRNPARLPATVCGALARSCDLIVLGGGDGSVSAAANDLARGQAVLGLLPLGTANDFARTMGIPDDLEAACATIGRGTIATIDLGLAGEAHYVNVVTLGLGADVAEAVSSRLKRLIGPLAYPVAAARAVLQYRPFAATLTFPDGDHEEARFPRLLQLAIGNGRFYGGGAVVAPDVAIDDGMLDVYAIELHTWHELIGVAWTLKSGRHIYQDGVRSWRTRRVRIVTRPALPVNIDGEVVDTTPEEFTVACGALRVLVPPNGT